MKIKDIKRNVIKRAVGFDKVALRYEDVYSSGCGSGRFSVEYSLYRGQYRKKEFYELSGAYDGNGCITELKINESPRLFEQHRQKQQYNISCNDLTDIINGFKSVIDKIRAVRKR